MRIIGLAVFFWTRDIALRIMIKPPKSFLAVAALAVCLWSPASHADCRSEMDEQMQYLAHTEDLAGSLSMRFDRLINGSAGDPSAEGCAMAAEVLPRFERSRQFFLRCVYSNPELRSEPGELERSIAQAETYLVQGKCGTR